jgi:serine/threonine protein kinase
MDPVRWRQIEDLYHEALKLPPDQRGTFLSATCGQDDDLRRQVDVLFLQSAPTDVLVGRPVWEAVAGVVGTSFSLEPGTRFGPYEILDPLGEGGMGKVYRALDTRLDRPVAIKVSTEHFTAQFEREARAISALNHPHVCTLYDVGPNFLVMELIDGETLAQRINRMGPLPLREALDIGLQVAEAMEAAHGKGIIHRDLKPANVKITPDSRVKVLDFGLARGIRDEAGEQNDSRHAVINALGSVTGHIAGTPAYMSPEQARGEHLDVRTDVWAFGCLLYELLAGKRVFGGNDNASTMAGVLEHAPDWRALPATTHAGIRELLRACLEKEAERRPPDMKYVRTSIEDALRNEGSKHRHVRTSLAVTLVVLAGAGLGAFLFRERASSAADELLRAIPLTSYPGNQSEPSFSPDGNQVAFSWDGERQDNFDIYVKRIGPGPPLRLTTNPAPEISPAWSPDGNWIAFLRASTLGRNAVVLIPSSGGTERIVAEVRGAPAVTRKNLTWAPDGKWLATFDQPEEELPGIWLLSIETGARRRLTTVPQGGSAPWDGGFEFAPDGRQVAFIRDTTGNSGDLFLQAVGPDLSPAGSPRRLTRENQDNVGLAWAAAGRELIVSSGPPGGEELWRMPVFGGARRQLTAQNEVLGVAVSERAHRLIFAQSRRELDIYRADLSGPSAAVGVPVPLIVSSRLDRSPRYSPDGKKIAFVSLRSGTWQLWVSDSDGNNPVQVTFFKRGEVALPQWNPDGREIGFVSTVEGPGYAYAVRADGGTPRKIQALEDVRPWRWSRDGRSILFVSSAGLATQIYKMPSAGGPIQQVTRRGLGFARAFTQSTDGKLIYYARPDGVWSVPIDGGVETKVFSFDRVGGAAFEASPKGIYFVGGGTTRKPGELMFFSFSDKVASKINGVESPSGYGLSLSPDGRHLLYTKYTGIGTDLMLVENFR